MQLSVLLPTHREGLAAVSRVAQACSWAGPETEIIVRDNSSDAKKRELIANFRADHCNIVIADPCEPLDNLLETFKLAKGEFVFLVADDDLCFDYTIEAVLRALAQFGKDPLVAGVTGRYAIDTSQGTALQNYKDVSAEDVMMRVSGYANNPGPNVLIYSALRREMVARIMSFIGRMPIFLSFHDQILSLLYLLCGRLIELPRLLYAYDLGVWESSETAQKRDIEFYTAAGLDPAMNKLHWFLCGFEGAVLIRNSNLFPDYPLAQRQPMADRWFSVMFTRFKGQPRSADTSRFTDEAEKVRAKLLLATGQWGFDSMLADICGLIALFAPDKAQHYHDFWYAQINNRVRDRAPRTTSGRNTPPWPDQTSREAVC